MKKFEYIGIDKNGLTTSGSTMGKSKEEVKAQLRQFGFRKIRIQESRAASSQAEQPSPAAEATDEDFVQRLVDGDIQIHAPVEGTDVEEEEDEEDEWRRAETLARVRKHRRRENLALVITLIIVGVIAAIFIYDKMTEIDAPQPKIIKRTANPMLSLEDVYVKGGNLVFVVFSREWNGNVRVEYEAWDAFGAKIDFGMKRIGHVGEYLGGSPRKSGAVSLKKFRYYDKIEIIVRGDEGK
jgi:hypothetical protein